MDSNFTVCCIFHGQQGGWVGSFWVGQTLLFLEIRCISAQMVVICTLRAKRTRCLGKRIASPHVINCFKNSFKQRSLKSVIVYIPFLQGSSVELIQCFQPNGGLTWKTAWFCLGSAASALQFPQNFTMSLMYSHQTCVWQQVRGKQIVMAGTGVLHWQHVGGRLWWHTWGERHPEFTSDPSQSATSADLMGGPALFPPHFYPQCNYEGGQAERVSGPRPNPRFCKPSQDLNLDLPSSTLGTAPCWLCLPCQMVNTWQPLWGNVLMARIISSSVINIFMHLPLESHTFMLCLLNSNLDISLRACSWAGLGLVRVWKGGCQEILYILS